MAVSTTVTHVHPDPLLCRAEIPPRVPDRRGLLGPATGSVTCPPGHDHAEGLSTSVS